MKAAILGGAEGVVTAWRGGCECKTSWAQTEIIKGEIWWKERRVIHWTRSLDHFFKPLQAEGVCAADGAGQRG